MAAGTIECCRVVERWRDPKKKPSCERKLCKIKNFGDLYNTNGRRRTPRRWSILESSLTGGQIAICHTFPLVDRSRALVAESPATPSNSYLLLCTTHARKIFFCRTLTEKMKMS